MDRLKKHHQQFSGDWTPQIGASIEVKTAIMVRKLYEQKNDPLRPSIALYTRYLKK